MQILESLAFIIIVVVVVFPFWGMGVAVKSACSSQSIAIMLAGVVK